MSKIILFFSVIFLFSTASGSILPAAAETYRPVNQRPMFGNIQKTQGMLDADDAFRDSIKKNGNTYEKAYEHLVKRGWQYFNSGDLGGAVQRFNQAWLLLPENSEAYQGFAVVRAVQEAPIEEVNKLFELAVTRKDKNPNAHVDYAKYMNMTRRPRAAKEQIEIALALDPKAPNAHLQMAAAIYSLEGRQASCAWFKMAVALGEIELSAEQIGKICED